MQVALFDVNYIQLVNCSTISKQVIMSLQLREENNEPLPLPSSGTRTKGSKRYLHRNKIDSMHSSTY